MTCCLTIKPLYVHQLNGAERSSWSPVFPGPVFVDNWDDAFTGTGNVNWLSEYSEELKKECFKLGADSSIEFGIGADLFDDDENCFNVNNNNQEFFARYKFEICDSVNMTWQLDGYVERKDKDFDFIILRCIRLYPDPESDWTTIAYVHGTDEDIDCEMIAKHCFATHHFDPGHYLFDIQIATGDGLHHKDFEWLVNWNIVCNGDSGGTGTVCPNDDAPFVVPPKDDDGSDNGPPYGLPPPGVGQPPTPGYRGECNCSHCIMIGIGVEVEGLVGGTCAVEFGGGATSEWVESSNALNGGYILSNHTDGWYQRLGEADNHGDPGVLIHKFTQFFPADPLVPTSTDSTNEYEVYCYRVIGSLECEDCTVGAAAGVQWSGTLGFMIQCRYRILPLDPPDHPDWTWIPCEPGESACRNIVFDQLVTQDCHVPPGCGGEVVYSNGANLLLSDEGTFCDCVVQTSFATATMYPIGTTTLC